LAIGWRGDYHRGRFYPASSIAATSHHCLFFSFSALGANGLGPAGLQLLGRFSD
jgi:hypothetical protein